LNALAYIVIGAVGEGIWVLCNVSDEIALRVEKSLGNCGLIVLLNAI
jgi:hypothetical protein